jgi:hypothetical protein
VVAHSAHLRDAVMGSMEAVGFPSKFIFLAIENFLCRF